jgi:rod shape-determining protein MreC
MLLIVLSIALMIMDKRLAAFSSVRALLSLPVIPIQFLVNLPTKWLGDVRTIINTHDNLVNENLRLKSDQLLLQSRLQRLIAIESENNYLKALMQSAQKAQTKTLIAELLAVNAEPFMRQVTLNKGLRNGVYSGQPVLDASGVMGQVIQVDAFTSRVLLVSDPHSGIAVQDVRNGMRSVAVGDSYSGKLRLLYVSKTTDVQPGDIFMTSGLGDRYPEGYPVGKVFSVINNPSQQFKDVLLEPSARLESSRQVLLIWYGQHA